MGEGFPGKNNLKIATSKVSEGVKPVTGRKYSVQQSD